jgi:cysteinyl-tRNA synthetase
MQIPVFQNTLGRRPSELETVAPGEVRMYTCGPTVYDTAHIGNLRTFLFEDVLRRSLQYLGWRVVQVMNLTDVDDKTIDGAARAGMTLREFTQPFIDSFFRDLDRLHIQRAEHYPRATEHIEEMLELVQSLLDKGYAYESDGSVFFRIGEDEDYGKLSGFDLSQMRRGERVASDDYDKEDVRDFVLWKGAKKGEPAWESPWGPGRPGWHLECSAMGMKYLGETFDIHCGGVDNIFPHHENEIAQSESATGRPFVHTWIHAEHLIVDGEKMSKSLGNFYTVQDLVDRGADLRALRYQMLSVHYRKKLNFTFDGLADAGAALKRLDEMRFRLVHSSESQEEASGSPIPLACERLLRDFGDALADDLNTSQALAALFGFVREVNQAVDRGQLVTGDRQRVLDSLSRVDQVLAVLDADEWRGDGDGELSGEEIDRLLDERQEARERRDFATADEIRDRLAGQGIVLEDTPSGTRWKRQ